MSRLWGPCKRQSTHFNPSPALNTLYDVIHRAFPFSLCDVFNICLRSRITCIPV